MENSKFDDSSEEKLAYDLRQRYATIVGNHLEDIAYYRKERLYSEWFRALEDLYTITEYKFKLTKEEKESLKKDKDAKDENKNRASPHFEFKAYTDLKQELIVVSNEHSETWKGNLHDSEDVAKIETALRNIEEWLYFKMNEVGMFGVKFDDKGL